MSRSLHLLVAAALVIAPATARAQGSAQSRTPARSGAQAAQSPTASAEANALRAAEHPISVDYYNVPLRDAVRRLAAFSGRTIVMPSELGDPVVNASYADVHWRRALDLVLETQGLVARDDRSGLIRIEKRERIVKRRPVG